MKTEDNVKNKIVNCCDEGYGKNLSIVNGKDLLMIHLVRFYKHKEHMIKIIPIIEGKSQISLRLIDWFVTNYSKKYHIILSSAAKHVDFFNVYVSYRQQLKAFSKQQFDPFRRRDRIRFFYDKENNSIETTIGQLNFFKWILQYNILEYIYTNITSIENDMISSQKSSDKNISVKKKKNMNVSKPIVNNNTNLGPKIVKFE